MVDEQPYAQFQIPGHPYSVVRFPLTQDWVAIAVEMAVQIADELERAFPEPDAPVQEEQRPRFRPAPAQQPRQQAVAYCPDHDMAPMQPSAARYNPEGDKFYHALAKPVRGQDGREVKNHTLWWRLTVDAEGNSNDGKVIPGVQQRRPVAAGDRDEEPPLYGDDIPF